MTGVSECRDEARRIASILAGDATGFDDLIRPHERTVYVMVLSLLQNEADAEDAQETFLKTFLNLASFRGEAKFSTWLVRIALNDARSRLRRKKSAKLGSLEEGGTLFAGDSPGQARDSLPGAGAAGGAGVIAAGRHRRAINLSRDFSVAGCGRAQCQRVGGRARHQRNIGKSEAPSRANDDTEEGGS